MPGVVVLLVEADHPLLCSEKLLFEANGYTVLTAHTRPTTEQLLGSHLVDIVVLGHSLSQQDREVLVARTRLVRPEARILVVHASGGIQPVLPDASVDSRSGPEWILDGLRGLLGMAKPQSERSLPARRSRWGRE